MSSIRPSATTQPRGPGRPRDHSRTDAILESVITVIAELGYEGMRVQDVADKAGVSLATIYRRWPTKTDLIIAAIEADTVVPINLQRTGNIEFDIAVLLEEIARSLAHPKFSRVAMIATISEQPLIRAAVQQNHGRRIRQHLHELLSEHIGAAHPSLDLLVDLGPAMVWYRTVVTGDAGDPARLGRELAALVLSREEAGRV